jgi:HlyD family secretion protein
MDFGADPIHTVEKLIEKNRIKGPSLYLLVLVVLIGCFASLPLINVDITSQSRGLVRTESENIAINSGVGGKVSFENMTDNQIVSKGDTLLMISAEALHAEGAYNDSVLKLDGRILEDYNRLIDGGTGRLKSAKVRKLYRAYIAELDLLKDESRSAQLLFLKHQKLFDKQVIAQSEFEEYQREMIRAEKALRLFVWQQRLSWEQEALHLRSMLEEAKKRSMVLRSAIKDHYLIAPVSGTLEQVVGLEVGAVVTPSLRIGNISPEGELVVENFIDPKDIGWIKQGQEVRFQFDAFPYQQWGILTGHVKEIDKNITLETNRSYFKVVCGFDNLKLSLPNGYQARISKGMTLTTSYFLSRRSLYALIFDKLENWLEPRKMRRASKEYPDR